MLATSGLVVNLLISYLYSDPAYLGIFNISYAMFIGLSQVTTFGFHISTLRYSVKFSSKNSQILTVSMLCVLTISVLTGMMVFVLKDFFSIFWDHQDGAQNLLPIIFAATIFSLNKVMMWAINAREDMTAYASFQIVRGAAVLGAFLLFHFYWSVDPNLIFACVLLGESIVFISLLIYCTRSIKFGRFNKRLFKVLSSFSRKSVPVGLISEVNLKVDVLCVGYFLSDSLTGIYSFMALFAEGFLSSMTVLKNFINPKIADSSYPISAAIELHRKYRLYLSTYGIIMIAGICTFYMLYLNFANPAEVFEEHTGVLLALIITPGILSSLLPFDQIFVYKGQPHLQTIYLMVILIVNFSLNIILIPFLSLWGAAIATGISMVAGQIYLNAKMRNKFGSSFLFPTKEKT